MHMGIPSNLLFDYLKSRFEQIDRIGAHQNAELTGFYHEAILTVPEAQALRRQREFDAPPLARAQTNAREPFQLFDRTRHTGGDIAQIKLHDFVAVSGAYVFNLHADNQLAVRTNS